jgi:hypothetical protein
MSLLTHEGKATFYAQNPLLSFYYYFSSYKKKGGYFAAGS